MTKRIIPVLLALLLLLAIPVSAHDVPQERNDCTIQVQVRYDGENVSGGTLTAVRVAYMDEDDGNYFFSRVTDHYPLTEIDSAQVASTLLLYYEKNCKDYTFDAHTVPVEDGVARFENLQTGLYLILQQTPAQGFSNLGPSVISLPYMLDGVYVYDVSVAVKSELEREPEPTEPVPTLPDDSNLPQTGQLNWPVPVMVVGGAALILLGCILRARKKDDYVS